ncbi:lipoprotein [Sphingosinicella rhizophila]|uniref:Lipoprotein n=1 Tax=Sphingosinicella rhizophila TaxID=3050082 RepID=A0ABU3Q3F4_9SPHN|nr:lipoprotein [Sphingosinicella sp. GR2756]MDT9597951.1 lipoprotein [Sphingosinicella sp. GR2756]
MKKIAITLAAVAAFTVAGCNGAADETANNVTDIEATDTEANLDVNLSAEDAAGNALDDLSNAADNAGDAIENVASDAGNVAENAVN